MSRTTSPVLPGRADGPDIAVWCAFCNKEHFHGRHNPTTGCKYDRYNSELTKCICPVGTGDGHRVAHCHNDKSPYADSGYCVVEQASKPKVSNDQHFLYRFFDANQVLLYIGITMSIPGRFRSHKRDKQWWSEIAHIRIENFDTREALQEAEKLAIKQEKPRYNVVHNTGPSDKKKSVNRHECCETSDGSCPTCPSCGSGHREWEKQPASFSLVGKWFHTTKTCNCGARTPCWQGRIIAEQPQEILLVQLYEWVMGEPAGQELIQLSDFMKEKPLLYDTPEDMRFSVDHGALQHTWTNDCRES